MQYKLMRPNRRTGVHCAHICEVINSHDLMCWNTVYVLFFLLESTTRSYLGNEMMSTGSRIPCWPDSEPGYMLRWIFPCMTAFLSAVTSCSDQSKSSSLCLIHTCAGVWQKKVSLCVSISIFVCHRHGNFAVLLTAYRALNRGTLETE